MEITAVFFGLKYTYIAYIVHMSFVVVLTATYISDKRGHGERLHLLIILQLQVKFQTNVMQ